MMNSDIKQKPIKAFIPELTGLTLFLKEKIVLTRNPADSIVGKELYGKYLLWCKSRYCIPYTRNKFYSNFEKTGNLRAKQTAESRKMYIKIQIIE